MNNFSSIGELLNEHFPKPAAQAFEAPRLTELVLPQNLEAMTGDPRVVVFGPGQYPWLCPNCGGNGIVGVFRIRGGPYPTPNRKSKWLDLESGGDSRRPSVSGWYDGESEYAPCPACRGNGYEYLRRVCGLSESETDIDLADFRLNAVTQGKAEALARARAVLGRNREAAGFITFWGDYGVGKSHLLKGLVNGFCRIGVRAHYTTLSQMLADIRERFGDGLGVVAVEQAVAELARVPVLAIDEVGDSRRVNLTGWANETTFKLLDQRYNERERVLTLLASNIQPSQMAPEWGYLRSRMSGGEVVEVPGPDMREYEDLLKQMRQTGRPLPEEEE